MILSASAMCSARTWITVTSTTGDCGGEAVVTTALDASGILAPVGSIGCLAVWEGRRLHRRRGSGSSCAWWGVTSPVGQYGSSTAGKYRTRPGRRRTRVDAGGRWPARTIPQSRGGRFRRCPVDTYGGRGEPRTCLLNGPRRRNPFTLRGTIEHRWGVGNHRRFRYLGLQPQGRQPPRLCGPAA